MYHLTESNHTKQLVTSLKWYKPVLPQLLMTFSSMKHYTVAEQPSVLHKWDRAVFDYFSLVTHGKINLC